MIYFLLPPDLGTILDIVLYNNPFSYNLYLKSTRFPPTPK